MPRKMPLDVAERLIQAVQKREVLYDTRGSGYKNRNITELTWKGVSDEVGQDVNFCRTSWAQLRSTFNRILAQLKSRPSGSAAGKGPKWYLYQHMLFLKDHVAHGSQTGSLTLSQSEHPESSQCEVPVVDIEPKVETPSLADSGDMVTVEIPRPEEVGVEGSGETSLWQTDFLELEVDEYSEQTSEASTSFSSAPREKTLASSSSRKRRKSKECLFLKGLVPYMQQLTERNKRTFISQTTSLCMELLDNQEGQQ